MRLGAVHAVHFGGMAWADISALKVQEHEFARTVGGAAESATSRHRNGDDLSVAHDVRTAHVYRCTVHPHAALGPLEAPVETERRILNAIASSRYEVDVMVAQDSDVDPLPKTAAKATGTTRVRQKSLRLEEYGSTRLHDLDGNIGTVCRHGDGRVSVPLPGGTQPA